MKTCPSASVVSTSCCFITVLIGLVVDLYRDRGWVMSARDVLHWTKASISTRKFIC